MGNKTVTPIKTVDDDKKEYVDCYNCSGSKMMYECGLPATGIMVNCKLCKNFGNYRGKILKQYSNMPIIIQDGNKYISFTPPSFNCIWCNDSKKVMEKVWDDEIANTDEAKRCSDNGFHLMPKFTVACDHCMPNEHKAELEEVKNEYFASKKKQTVGC
ncbi:MAG: hypothetical protein Edafosvirus1_139 [Edafosvirus sp.]|uniref:Uncharacterized protein n=1 Tax=Edafosvirus sp. TaxID=2487765 RepID=A0A3G4ZSE2_9VIRU|nr:MAG: hypothetical protein Edafosvirus1_139 [Edafosvirus sp.]